MTVRQFLATGTPQQWIVPAGVTSVLLECWGGQGGGHSGFSGQIQEGGGKGGYVKGTFAVAPGQKLFVFVGPGGWNAGQPGVINANPNGGGAAPSPQFDNVLEGSGGQGGGASDVRFDVNDLAHRKIVAGGGGGAAGYGGSGTFITGTGVGNGAGGDGGGASGSAGFSSSPTGSGGAGGGGTSSGGGNGGTPGTNLGSPGALGTGGPGGSAISMGSNAYGGGGGGGGGYYGGGGGASVTATSVVTSQWGGAGGGGSSYVDSGATSPVDTAGVRGYTGYSNSNNYKAQDGFVQITYSVAPLAPTLINPTTNSYIDVAQAQTFSWAFNASPEAPNDAQVGYEIRYRIGSGTYTTVAGTSALTQNVFASSTFTTGNTYEWNVRTKGADGVFGDWSPSYFVNAGTAPATPTITAPTTASTVTTTPVTVNWTSSGQVAWQIQLVGDSGGSANLTDIRYDTFVVSGPALTFNLPLVNNLSTMHIRLRIQNSIGFWSAWADITITTNFLAPSTPALSLLPLPDQAAIQIAVTNPGAQTATTRYNRILDPGAEHGAHAGGIVNTVPNNYPFATGGRNSNAATTTTAQAHSGSSSHLCSWGAPVSPWTSYTARRGIAFATGNNSTLDTASRTWTGSCWVYVPSGNPDVQLLAVTPDLSGTTGKYSGYWADNGSYSSGEGTIFATGSSTSTKDQWVQLTVTLTTAQLFSVTAPIYLEVLTTAQVSGAGQFYVDDVLLEDASGVLPYFDGDSGNSSWLQATDVSTGFPFSTSTAGTPSGTQGAVSKYNVPNTSIADHNDIYRQGPNDPAPIKIASGVPPNSTVLDRTPASGVAYQYTVLAYSIAGGQTPGS